MALYGYILDESDFEVIPTVNRAVVLTEIMDLVPSVKLKIKPTQVPNVLNYNFVFKKNSPNSFSYNIECDIKFYELMNLTNISNIIINVNNVTVLNGLTILSPIVVNANDLIFISISRITNDDSDFTLVGNII
jgi:hypothetical protein